MVKYQGEWIHHKKGYIKIDGEWEEIVEGYVKIDGVWQRVRGFKGAVSNMPYSRMNHQIAFDSNTQDYFYIFGGESSIPTSSGEDLFYLADTAMIYDVNSDTYTTKNNMPRALSNMYVCFIPQTNKILLINGVYYNNSSINNGYNYSSMYEYDLATDTYALIGTTPTTGYTDLVCYDGNRTVYMARSINDIMYKYDVIDKTFTPNDFTPPTPEIIRKQSSPGVYVPPLLSRSYATVFYNNMIYCFNGTTTSTVVRTYDVLTGVITDRTIALGSGEGMIATRTFGAMVYIQNGNLLYIYDMDSFTSTYSPQVPSISPRPSVTYASGAYDGEYLYIFSGREPYVLTGITYYRLTTQAFSYDVNDD